MCASFSFDQVKICELLATEGNDTVPTKPALVKCVSQDKGQSFPAIQEKSSPVSNSPDLLFPWIKRSFKSLEAVISCTQKARSLDPNAPCPIAWEVKFFFLSDNKVKAKAVLLFDLYYFTKFW